MYTFVFDFDQTLIMGHSGGIPDISNNYDTDDCIILELIKMFNALKKKSISIYINTRGIAKEVKKYLKHRFEKLGENSDNYIKDVMGAVFKNEISNGIFDDEEFLQIDAIVENKLKEQGLNDDQLKDPSSRIWAFQKSAFLDHICELEKVANENVYFFDDTAINILFAKSCGFSNSFVIFDPDSPHDHPDFRKPEFNPENFSYLAFTIMLVYKILQTF